MEGYLTPILAMLMKDVICPCQNFKIDSFLVDLIRFCPKHTHNTLQILKDTDTIQIGSRNAKITNKRENNI